MPEIFPTLWAVIQFLSCVNALVCFESTLISKSLPTLWAVIRFYSCVDALVVLEITLISKTLSTLRAALWLLSCVDAPVCFKIAQYSKTFSTFKAVTWFLSCVDALVFFEITLCSKTPPTFWIVVISLFAVFLCLSVRCIHVEGTRWCSLSPGMFSGCHVVIYCLFQQLNSPLCRKSWRVYGTTFKLSGKVQEKTWNRTSFISGRKKRKTQFGMQHNANQDCSTHINWQKM